MNIKALLVVGTIFVSVGLAYSPSDDKYPYPTKNVTQIPIDIPINSQKPNVNTDSSFLSQMDNQCKSEQLQGQKAKKHKKNSSKKTFTQRPMPNLSGRQIPMMPFKQVPGVPCIPFPIMYPGLPFPVMRYPGLPFPVMYLPGMPGPAMLVPFCSFPNTMAPSRAPIPHFQNSDNSN